MGAVPLELSSNKMKFLVVLALLAFANAEPEAEPKADADPAWYYNNFYGGVGYPHTYGLGYYNQPYLSHYGYALGHGYRYLGKRDAEAEPEADANPDARYGYGYARPYAYNWGGYHRRPYGYYGGWY